MTQKLADLVFSYVVKKKKIRKLQEKRDENVFLFMTIYMLNVFFNQNYVYMGDGKIIQYGMWEGSDGRKISKGKSIYLECFLEHVI